MGLSSFLTLRVGLDPAKVTVLTPYRGQLRCLRDMKRNLPSNLDVPAAVSRS